MPLSLLKIHAMHYVHKKICHSPFLIKSCQENPIGTSLRVILTELKVVLEYEIVSYLKA